MSFDLGENVTLECIANASISITRLEWVEENEGGSRPTSIFRKKTPLSQDADYNKFYVRSDGKTFWNLIIDEVSHRDEGVYACYACTKDCVKWRYNLTVFGTCKFVTRRTRLI